MTLIALGLIHFRRKGSVILNFSELLFWKKTVTNQLLDKDHSSSIFTLYILKAFGSKESAPFLPTLPISPKGRGITGKNEKIVVAGCLSSNKHFSFVKKNPSIFFRK